MKGYVYILTHKRMPGIVKVGYTTKALDQRLGEICRSPGVPGAFDVFRSWEVFDPCRVERMAHAALRPFRISPDKEFFEVGPGVAKDHIERILASGDLAESDAMAKAVISDARTLGKFIKDRRKSEGMTQRQLSQKAGTGLRFVVEVERGKSTMQIGKVFLLLEALRAGFSLSLVGGGDLPSA